MELLSVEAAQANGNALLQPSSVDGYLAFDETECRTAGRMLASDYRTADPFPHVVIPRFLPVDLLRAAAEGFPDTQGKRYFDRDQERLKYQFDPSESPSRLVRNLLAELNGRAFLAFLEELTGIRGLVSDPYFSGGGLHEIKRGGHLAVHADFNIHEATKLERRLNVLIYLNEDWLPEYGGNLELWDTSMKACRRSVAPTIGTAVIFSTNLDSYHGHPDPITCPPERSRRSIATYYYTALEEGLARVPHRTTNFKVRPGSGDRTDWQVRRRHLVADWTPPAVRRLALNARARLARSSVLRPIVRAIRGGDS